MKYWYVSYYKIRRDMHFGQMFGAVLDFHPFKAIAQWSNSSDFFKFTLGFFQEISKEEFKLYKSLEE